VTSGVAVSGAAVTCCSVSPQPAIHSNSAGMMGGGMGASTWAFPNRAEAGHLSKEEELKRLRDQVNALRNQLEAIEGSISDLEEQ